MTTTKKLSEVLGTTQEGYMLDGSNYIDEFPVLINDSGRPTSPVVDDFTIAGMTLRSEFWSEGDFQGYIWELNHFYKSGGNPLIHARVFPENDLAGAFEFEYQFIINSIDVPTGVIYTRAGATITLNGSFNAGDYSAGKGVYVSTTIDGTALNLKSGEMLKGNFKRNNSAYNDDIVIEEIGLHLPIGKQGAKF